MAVTPAAQSHRPRDVAAHVIAVGRSKHSTAYRNDEDIVPLPAWNLPFTYAAGRFVGEASESVAPAITGTRDSYRPSSTAARCRSATWASAARRTDSRRPLATRWRRPTTVRGSPPRRWRLWSTRCSPRACTASRRAPVDPANMPSAAVLERVGFRFEGRDVEVGRVRGEWHDDDRYAMHRRGPGGMDQPAPEPAGGCAPHRRSRPKPNGTSAAMADTPAPRRASWRPSCTGIGDALLPDLDGSPVPLDAVVPGARGSTACRWVGDSIAEATDGYLAGTVLWRLLVDRGPSGPRRWKPQ